MVINCAGCGKELTLGYDLNYELNLSLKWRGTQEVSKAGEWLSVTKSYCEQCHEQEKDLLEYHHVKHMWECENV